MKICPDPVSLLAEGETAQAWRFCRTLVQGSADRIHGQGYEEAIDWLKRMAVLHRKQGSR